MMVLVIICAAIGCVTLMYVGYLYTQMRLMMELLKNLSETEASEPLNAAIQTLSGPKKRKKARRFTDKSRDWLEAHEFESRR